MKIKFVKEVVFKDMHGTILKVFSVGDVIPYTHKSSHYFVTTMGGIYFDEADEVIE